MSAKEIVATAYDAIGKGDGETFVGLLADDVVLIEPEGHPYPGTWEGKEAVVAALPGLLGALRLQGLTVHGIMADGENVIGMIELTCTSESGAPVSAPALEHWIVRDGKIRQAKPYYHSVVTLSREMAS
jgi:ketosteroid isomerase-like protein